MTLPVLESVSTQGEGTTPASSTISKPSGTAEGDLLIWVVTVAKPAVVQNPNLPSGWTEEYAAINTGQDLRLEVYSKVAGSSEPSSYTVDETDGGNPRWAHAMFRISGAHASSYIDVMGTNDEGTSETSQSCNSITTTQADCLALWCLLFQELNDTTVSTNPGTSAARVPCGNGFGPFLAVDEEDFASAGATGAQAWGTDEAKSWMSVGFAIAPVAGGGGGATVGRLVNGGLVNGGLVNRGLL